MARERYTQFLGREGITRRQIVEQVRAALWTERTTNEAHWRDLNDFVSPRKARWFVSDRNKGDRRNQKIIDSTATFALRTLQSGMHAGMTNPARQWMRLLTPDQDLNEYEPVKEWLHTVTLRMLTRFSQTNLYNALPVHYGMKGLFATAATGMLNDDEQVMRFYSYPIGSYAIATNARGQICQWVYQAEKTVYEIVESYLVDKRTNMIDWSRASQALRNCWERGQFNDKVPVYWLVMPNFDRDPTKLYPARSMPYVSFHVEQGQERDDTFLKESGFNEFPILASRWDVTGDDWYGTDCPGMVALGDVKQLQTGEKRSMQAVEKYLNPPLQGPSSVRNQKASLLPGDITYVDVREGQKGLAPIHEVQLPIDKLELKQEATRNRIRRAYYEDLFLMLANSDGVRGAQPPTATEIVERKEEKLIAIGPVLERSKDELHDPLIDRAFAMMLRAGHIPRPPDELRGMPLRVEYVSIMAQAQKLVGVVGHERFLNGASQLIAVEPRIRFKINWFQAIEDYNDMLGNNPKLVVSDDDANRMADQAAQAAAAAERAKANAQNANAVKSLANSPTADGSTVLDKMAEQQAETSGVPQ